MQLKIKWVDLLIPHMPLQTSPWSRSHVQVRVTCHAYDVTRTYGGPFRHSYVIIVGHWRELGYIGSIALIEFR
jgi:hypothetical protein